MNERLHLRIRGKVQGVFYRLSTKRKARSLDLVGWVRNLEDGSVEAVAEGPRPALEALLAWCHQGPPGAKVEEVLSGWSPATREFQAFTVHR